MGRDLQMKGIILIGIGDYYQKLAYNLLKSIRKFSDIPVTLITDDLTPYFISEFDNVVEPKMCHYFESNRINPFKLKTFINEYTPYEKTLYLDVDTVCLKNFESIFDLDFYIQEVGRYTFDQHLKCHMVWVRKAGLTIQDIFKAYKLPKDRQYPEYNSSVILFTKEHSKYFKVVQKAYTDRRINFKDIGGRYPDELAFNLASAITKTYNKDITKKMYFHWENKIHTLTDITNKYYFLGMAGGYHNGKLRHMYESLVKGISPFYKFISKKKIFHEQ